MYTCPYCGSVRVKTETEKSDSPFDKRVLSSKMVCLDCKRTLPGSRADMTMIDMRGKKHWRF